MNRIRTARRPARQLTFITAILVSSGMMLSANAQSLDDVLAENALVKLTRGDYEADLQRIPADSRESFATDPKRLTQFLNNLLLAKTLAAEARNNKIDRDPTVARRIGLEADRLLAGLQIQAIEEAAGREFDQRSPQLVGRARELYLIDPKKYVRPEQVSTSQIVFQTATRDPNASLALARDARAKLLAGADFGTLASQLSEDPVTKFNSGRLGWQSAGDMDSAVGKAAFELKNPGDLSEPVQARDGYRIIRLEGRRAPAPFTFEEVKDQILADMRKRYVDDQREARINAIRNDPDLKVNQVAIDGLVRRTNPELLRRSPDLSAPAAK